uniref:Tudor-knot domain-containing protein n=1 Tax=Rhabditophanes sp. KR3021 TaxID=114890 RepID=A0AC35TTP7_9BILA
MKFSISKLLISLIVTSIVIIDACKILVKLKSDTTKKFKLQLTVPSISYESEPLTFDKKGVVQSLKVKGPVCNLKKWTFQTFKHDEETDAWIKAEKLEAKIEGDGWMTVLVGKDYKPWINDRNQIFCSEGQCM